MKAKINGIEVNYEVHGKEGAPWLAIGASYQYSEQMRIDAGYVRLVVDDGDIDHTSATYSNLKGHFESSGNVFGISGQYRF